MGCDLSKTQLEHASCLFLNLFSFLTLWFLCYSFASELYVFNWNMDSHPICLSRSASYFEAQRLSFSTKSHVECSLNYLYGRAPYSRLDKNVNLLPSLFRMYPLPRIMFLWALIQVFDALLNVRSNLWLSLCYFPSWLFVLNFNVLIFTS